MKYYPFYVNFWTSLIPPLDIQVAPLGQDTSLNCVALICLSTLGHKLIDWGRGHLYFRLDIILVKGLLKQTLNTYFSGMKIYPKYMFLHAFLLICPSCPFQNLLIWPKTHPFPILHFFAPLISYPIFLFLFLFLRWWYPTSNTSVPPGLLSTPRTLLILPFVGCIWD